MKAVRFAPVMFALRRFARLARPPRAPLAAAPRSVSARFMSDIVEEVEPMEPLPDGKSAEIPSGWKGIKRFYDEVSIRAVDAAGNEVLPAEAAGYRIVIRGRELRTNGMNELTVRMLATPVGSRVFSQGFCLCASSCPLAAWHWQLPASLLRKGT